MATNKYENEVLEWRTSRYEGLIRENGWLALAGLGWISEGRNLIGSNPMCEVVLPDRAPTFLGIVELKGNIARFQAAEGVRAEVNGRLTNKAILKSSQDEKPSFITWNDIRMVLHTHVDKFAIRVWDNQRKERFTLPPLKWFPVNKAFRISARYTPYPEPKEMPIEDTFGEMVESNMDGYVTFKYNGNTYKLDATETKDHSLFIKFRDETSSKEAYPPSRYYYTDPVKGGKVILDFNYSYSPPCAFTEYATCIFAPAQNRLPFRVEAGEIYRG